jgi:hypothetical protein
MCLDNGDVQMSELFMAGISDSLNLTTTANGAIAYKTTNSSLLDFFARGGAFRSCAHADIIQALSTAYSEDALIAIRTMFYFRDVRHGQGERDTFRKQLTWLASAHPDVVRKNIAHIPTYGRWDDLYALFNTELEGDAIQLMKTQLQVDLTSDKPSLLAKWLKSENTSSKESQMLGRKTRRGFGMSAKTYRQTLSVLRKKIGVIETLMSANKWENVDYKSVPSQANLKYAKAFLSNDKTRRLEFIEMLKAGKTTIHAGTTFPYEIVRFAQTAMSGTSHERDLADQLWKALPDYIGDTQENAIAVVDVSGSMMGLPMEVAISVGMYLAERNKCPAYHNKFITFSGDPELVTLKGATFCERINNIRSANWEFNTDLERVLSLILDVAIANRLKSDELPHKLYIISDMSFDHATVPNYNSHPSETMSSTLIPTIAERFKSHDYKMPNIVFWNVNATDKQFPIKMDERGFQLVSGCSPTIFTQTMAGNFLSAYDLMILTVNSERYQLITV